jgi:hypothetical protein
VRDGSFQGRAHRPYELSPTSPNLNSDRFNVGRQESQVSSEIQSNLSSRDIIMTSLTSQRLSMSELCKRCLTWPATRPSPPTALPRSAITRNTRSAGTPFVARAMCSKEKDNRASPARMATSSPYFCSQKKMMLSVHENHNKLPGGRLSGNHSKGAESLSSWQQGTSIHPFRDSLSFRRFTVPVSRFHNSRMKQPFQRTKQIGPLPASHRRSSELVSVTTHEQRERGDRPTLWFVG